jgi:hypothetical protein
MREAQPDAAELSDERRDVLIERLAQRVEALGLSAAAILMLEAHKPLSFVGSQAILILQPLLSFAIDTQTSREYAQLLEQRANVELLIRRLERQGDNSARSAA